MNEALQIMSAQYELMFSLSESPELKKMLRQFLRVCNPRLNLISSHIYLFHDKANHPSHIDDSKNNHLLHYTSLPSQKDGDCFSEDTLLLNEAIEFINSNEVYKESQHGDVNQYCLSIKNYGVLIIESHNDLNDTLRGRLTPVFNRLSLSCNSAINRERLIREIGARKSAEQQILYQANHDELTGLYNRRAITKKINKAIKKCPNNGLCGAVIFIDLNEFKNINDLMGHNIGDEVLTEVAYRLQKATRKEYFLARFGGDEFIVLLHASNEDEVENKILDTIKKISAAIKKTFLINGSNYSLSCCFGYDIFSSSDCSSEQLIKNADLAMYEAKRSSTIGGLRYDSAMSDRLNTKINYEVELKRALQRDEFELHYQPQYNHLGNIIGTEALLRWNNPERGYESPAIYIPIAEQSDLIIHISEWVLNQACHDIRELEKLSPPASFKKTSINISAKHIAKPDFVDNIVDAVNKHKINPKHFAIEITEGIMMGNIESAIGFLQTLKEKHIQCSIDDFGTGYSSLAYLKKLPASVIKIDRAFVKDLDTDKDNHSIVQLIIDLGRNLNMEIIAEGVETQAELDCLIEMGCYQYQGFFFCKPVPFEQLVELLSTNASPQPTGTR
ncbi:MAG: diguanylate cyclase (GGDEF)-like protein [Candidatus Endobugula sp.]|jgi:diguanylate cyclase (GGDEF)-like protein